ncbi:MAG: response regulator [Phycisphaerae bacterium]
MQDSASDSDRPGRTVLIVDDNESVRKVAARMLSKLGYLPCQAGTGRDAIDLFDSADQKVDLALVDLTMPDMDGLEICWHLRSRQPKLPVVLCSGYAMEQVQEKMRNETRMQFCPKPFTIETLRSSLDSVLR